MCVLAAAAAPVKKAAAAVKKAGAAAPAKKKKAAESSSSEDSSDSEDEATTKAPAKVKRSGFANLIHHISVNVPLSDLAIILFGLSEGHSCEARGFVPRSGSQEEGHQLQQ